MQTTDTDTPRTDARELVFALRGDSSIRLDDVIDAYEFSRQLERELNQAKADIVELNQRLIERREAYEAYCSKITKVNHPLPELVAKVLQWGIDKGITGPNGKGRIAAQASKLKEEAEEVYDEIAILDSGDSLNPVMLEIGDVFVSAILLCEMLKLTPEQCLQAAYTKISQRAGSIINGSFVKSK